MNFNSIAPIYEPLARLVFGNEHRRAEVFFLPEVPVGSRVLLVGGGAGHLLRALLASRHSSAVLYLEPSTAMCRRAQRRVRAVPGSADVVFLRKSGELAGHAPCDVLMTPYVLDVFPDDTLREQFLPPLLRALTPEARWLFTDFVPPQRPAQRQLLRAMYLFFRLTTGLPARHLPDYGALFLRAGFRQLRRKQFAGGMIETRLLARYPPEH